MIAATTSPFHPPRQQLQNNKEDVDIPKEFLCAKSGMLMLDPVKTIYGHNFQRDVLGDWFSSMENACPITNNVLGYADISDNDQLKLEIECWLEKHPEHRIQKVKEDNDGYADDDSESDIENDVSEDDMDVFLKNYGLAFGLLLEGDSRAKTETEPTVTTSTKPSAATSNKPIASTSSKPIATTPTGETTKSRKPLFKRFMSLMRSKKQRKQFVLEGIPSYIAFDATAGEKPSLEGLDDSSLANSSMST